MINKNTILVQGVARGGTGLVMDLLLSHPDVCKTGGELQEVFTGKAGSEHWLLTMRKRISYLPIVAIERGHIFSSRHLYERNLFSTPSKFMIDRILHASKCEATDATQNLYKRKGVKYTEAERKKSRLLCKNLNGLVFTSNSFRDMYPDAVFISIIRNGLAVCEGQIRRGSTVDEAANAYQKVVSRIHKDASTNDNSHVYRYEDIVNDPAKSLSDIYDACSLDINQVKHVRLISRPLMDENGVHRVRTADQAETLNWIPLSELRNHVYADINTNQIDRLSEENKSRIIEIAGEALRTYGYID